MALGLDACSGIVFGDRKDLYVSEGNLSFLDSELFGLYY